MRTLHPITRSPPNKGVYRYFVKMRRRYDGLTCGKWSRWLTIRVCTGEQQAILARNRESTSATKEIGIFYRGRRIR